jgi:hypothetical protein
VEEVRQLETQLSAYFGVPDDASADAKSAGESIHVQIFRDLDPFAYWLQNFDNFQNQRSKIVLFEAIASWLRNRVESLPPEILEMIKTLLFERLIASEDSIPPQ